MAIPDLDKAIEFSPRWVDAHLSRGYAYTSKAQWDRAIADFTRVIELAPGVAAFHYDRGLAYASAGQKEPAIADFNKTIELSDDPELIQLAQKLIQQLGNK